MQKSEGKTSAMVRIPLPGGRVARVPITVLETYVVDGLHLAHDPSTPTNDVTAHGMVVDQATMTNVWHTDVEYGPCEYVDENGYHHATVAYHCHPFGTEYTEIVSQ